MRKLKTEQNTIAMSVRVKVAAAKAKLGSFKLLQSDFERGQWWITNRRTGGQWAAGDAEGPGSYDGFIFEQVTKERLDA